ncbi:GNAT superfamily N-acetyltransferase [Bacilli bacterium PM5-3]|nr:GNAT superfamily N-acetyltransferase [Bacilli bacterium PM5-3]MDH6604006.1 GNAT superfamily N-acetyltransferase [Bacilli bacterium PM5-9]
MIKTRIDDYVLKEATIDDCELVYKFILELAEYEEMKHGVKGTIEDLKESVFKRNEAEILLAYYGDEPVGFCVFCKTFSTFLCKSYLYLDDLFIVEKYRKRGFGKELLCQLGMICKERNLERIEWFCFGWNDPSLDFYKNALHASFHPELDRFRWDIETIERVMGE